jgi:hypothetical protein
VKIIFNDQKMLISTTNKKKSGQFLITTNTINHNFLILKKLTYMNSRVNKKIRAAGKKLNSRLENQIQKKELLIDKISGKLGKSPNEVESIVGESLINLLSLVPFSTKHA